MVFSQWASGILFNPLHGLPPLEPAPGSRLQNVLSSYSSNLRRIADGWDQLQSLVERQRALLREWEEFAEDGLDPKAVELQLQDLLARYRHKVEMELDAMSRELARVTLQENR